MNLLWESNFGDSGHVSQRDSSPFFNLMFSPLFGFSAELRQTCSLRRAIIIKSHQQAATRAVMMIICSLIMTKLPPIPLLTRWGCSGRLCQRTRSQLPRLPKAQGGEEKLLEGKKKISFASLCSFQCLELIKAVKKKSIKNVYNERITKSQNTVPIFFFFSVITQEFPS